MLLNNKHEELTENQVELIFFFDYLKEIVTLLENVLEDKKVSFAESISLLAKFFSLPKAIKTLIVLDYKDIEKDLDKINEAAISKLNMKALFLNGIKLVESIKEIVTLLKPMK